MAEDGLSRETIEHVAGRLEADLELLRTCWNAMPAERRPEVIVRIGLTAPGIARLLCPLYSRFGR